MRVNIMSVYSDHRSERLLEVIGFADRVPCRNADCGISSCASPRLSQSEWIAIPRLRALFMRS